MDTMSFHVRFLFCFFEYTLVYFLKPYLSKIYISYMFSFSLCFPMVLNLFWSSGMYDKFWFSAWLYVNISDKPRLDIMFLFIRSYVLLLQRSNKVKGPSNRRFALVQSGVEIFPNRALIYEITNLWHVHFYL